jgi:hypothetical protein
MAFIVACVFITSCLAAGPVSGFAPKITLVGCTPGDAQIKPMLSIPLEKQVDFIRWNLTLDQAAGERKTFVMSIVFGEGQPNTRGFKGGGETKSIEGHYTISKSERGDIYHLTGKAVAGTIALLRLNENLFHLLTPDNLMVGNGGWSYSLTKAGAPKTSPVLSSWTTPAPAGTAGTEVFAGRSPCLDPAFRHMVESSDSCLKLKWKLTLSRDPETNQPANFKLESTLNRVKPIEGKWAIVKGIKNNPGAVVYRLELDKGPLSFLVGDENVLFFLNKDDQLLSGNEDFSFTLNRSVK